MAKALVAIFVLTFVVGVTLGQEYVRGYPAKNLQRSISRARAACGTVVEEFDDCTPNCTATPTHMDCTCKTLPPPYFGPICHSDCYTRLSCMGADTSAIHQDCASIDPKKPYCQGNACTATKPSDESVCRRQSAEFTCTGDGQYPNPENCNEYFFCTNNTAERYLCPPNYVYDSKTGFCKQKKLTSDCQTIKCVAGSPLYQVFAADKSILIFCNPANQEIILFRCSDTSLEYNPETLQCDFVCTAEGRFPVEGVTNQFYECYRDGTKFTYTKQTCPSPYIFCKTEKTCKAICPV